MLLAIVVSCAVGIAVVAIEKANRRFEGPLRGADFVHFYTLGHRAVRASHLRHGPPGGAARGAGRPLTRSKTFPGSSLALSSAGSGAVCAHQRMVVPDCSRRVECSDDCRVRVDRVECMWQPVSARLPDRNLLMVLAAAFPPFWMLVLDRANHDRDSGAFWAGWMALERRHHVLAGAAFGLLAIKPQFGIPLAVVVLARRDWAMLGGAVTSVALQAGPQHG